MYEFSCICTVHAGVHVYTHIKRPETDTDHLSQSFTMLFWRQDLSVNTEFTDLVVKVFQSLTLQSSDYRLRVGLYARLADTLPPDPSLRPLAIFHSDI